jgi:hypothetical protein
LAGTSFPFTVKPGSFDARSKSVIKLPIKRGPGLQPVVGHTTTAVRLAPHQQPSVGGEWRWSLRRKKLSPDRMILIEVGLKGDKVARTTQYVNQTEVPSLCPDWEIFVQRCVRSFLAGRPSHQEASCNEYQRQLIRHLELVISIYVQERLIRTSPITWDDLLSNLEAFAAALTPILEKLNKLSPADPVWVRIQKQNPRASLANARAVITALSENARAALARAKAERAEGKGRTYTGPWIDLVNALADLFEAIGLKLTAAKSSRAADPRTSQFVVFVWTVMTKTVPERLREYVSGTQSSMAGEINKVLAKRRKSGRSARGAYFTNFPTE